MILSNVSIQEALDEGWLFITPEPSPRELTVEDKCPYQTSAVDLTLSAEIIRPTSDLPVVIDLRESRYAALAEASSEPFYLTEVQPFNLAPGKFVLGRTQEEIKLPILPRGTTCLAARIEGRSSFARCGLFVHFTAPTVHAGFEGPLVLEMCNWSIYDSTVPEHAYLSAYPRASCRYTISK